MDQTTVQLQPGQITDLYAASGINPAKTLVIQNVGTHEFAISENSDMDGGMFLFPVSEPWENIIPGSAYALSSGPALVSVSNNAFKPVTQIGEKIPLGSFSGTRALTIQTYTEANVKNGFEFFARLGYPLDDDIGAGESKYLLWSTTSKPVIFKERAITYVGEELQYEIFANPTVTDNGTLKQIGDFNGYNGQASTVVMYKDATVSDDGTPIYDEPEYYYGSNTASRTQITYSQSVETITPPNTNYLLKITNNGSQSARLQWNGHWYEGDPDLPRPAGELD